MGLVDAGDGGFYFIQASRTHFRADPGQLQLGMAVLPTELRGLQRETKRKQPSSNDERESCEREDEVWSEKRTGLVPLLLLYVLLVKRRLRFSTLLSLF